MTRRPGAPPLSRRTLLAGLGGAGLVGALGGAGTTAFFVDGERASSNAFRAGALDLELRCSGDGCGPAVEDGLRLDLPDLHPGDVGTATVHLGIVDNPGWLWLATSCPTSPLEEILEVRLVIDRSCDGTDRTTIAGGTLRSVLEELVAGRRLLDSCLRPAEEICLRIEWAFPRPDDLDVTRYEGLDAAVEFRFHTEQCRHNDGLDSPFGEQECEPPESDDRRGLSYLEVWGCLAAAPECACTRLGRLELSDAYAGACDGLATDGITENRIRPGRYDLPVDDDCDDSGYDLLVTDTSERDGETTAIAFELLDDAGEPGPDLCRVVIKAGPTRVTYESGDLEPRSNATPGELDAEDPAR